MYIKVSYLQVPTRTIEYIVFYGSQYLYESTLLT